MTKLGLIVSTFVPRDTTGSTCQKSPLNTITFSPNTNRASIISFKVLSNALIAHCFAIEASSHITDFVLLSNSTVPLFLLMLQKLDSLALIGILNLECDV